LVGESGLYKEFQTNDDGMAEHNPNAASQTCFKLRNAFLSIRNLVFTCLCTSVAMAYQYLWMNSNGLQVEYLNEDDPYNFLGSAACATAMPMPI
jgi:hypothetical protein